MVKVFVPVLPLAELDLIAVFIFHVLDANLASNLPENYSFSTIGSRIIGSCQGIFLLTVGQMLVDLIDFHLIICLVQVKHLFEVVEAAYWIQILRSLCHSCIISLRFVAVGLLPKLIILLLLLIHKFILLLNVGILAFIFLREFLSELGPLFLCQGGVIQSVDVVV